MKQLSISWLYLSLLISALIINGCTPDRPEVKESPVALPPKKTTPIINYNVIARYPHDSSLYTEGLLFHEGKLFESSGAPSHLPQTRSTFGISDLKTGKFEIKGELDRNIYFGEGIVIIKNKLYQLTYQNQVCFVYDAKSFKKIGQFNYQNKEGWGLTTDGTHLIMSDGTYDLTYFNPDNFSVVKVLPVLKDGFGLDRINELEYIKGYIYANVWMTNLIVKIDPATGIVTGQIDLSTLYDESVAKNPDLGELNGIAYDSIQDRILVTGKLWPNIFEIGFPH
jgi:glutaminyl-peptide cyclotransferase